MASFDDMNGAAAQLIADLQQLDHYRNTRVAIIGGVALWSHLPSYRATQVRIPFPHSCHYQLVGHKCQP